MQSERKHTLHRIKSGDYLLPSNDRSIIWRITRYTEEGTVEVWRKDGSKGWLAGTFWSLWRYTGRHPDAINVNEWNDFEQWDSLLPTRQSAIDAAMKVSTITPNR